MCFNDLVGAALTLGGDIGSLAASLLVHRRIEPSMDTSASYYQPGTCRFQQCCPASSILCLVSVLMSHISCVFAIYIFSNLNAPFLRMLLRDLQPSPSTRVHQRAVVTTNNLISHSLSEQKT